jgi:hypothetical protein
LARNAERGLRRKSRQECGANVARVLGVSEGSSARENCHHFQTADLMCFSPTASFSLSALLAGLGAESFARSSSSEYRLFAATPFLFAAQQAAEGVVWSTIDNPMHAMANRGGVAVFLGLGLVMWPIWLPATLHAGEHDPVRRRVLSLILAFGALVSLSALALLNHTRPAAVVAGQVFDTIGRAARARCSTSSFSSRISSRPSHRSLLQPSSSAASLVRRSSYP